MNGVNIAKIRCYFLCEPSTFFNISLAYKVTIIKNKPQLMYTQFH
jgi:hypothetical protein